MSPIKPKRRNNINPPQKNSSGMLKREKNKRSSLEHNVTTENEKNSNEDEEEETKDKPKHKSVYSIDDFEFVSTITRGAFGIIELVKHKDSGKPFVLKKINKSSIMKDKQISHLKSEKSISLNSNINRDFIIECYDTLQDENSLYFILEFACGGDLHTLSKKSCILRIDEIKFYIAEVILAIEELHKHNIVYRDLKLDNIMIAADGHIKILDLQNKLTLDSKGEFKKTKTHCGTPEYLAPEIILNTGCDLNVDIWSLGILLCELIGGFTPFHSPDSKILYDNIINVNINWPKNADKVCKNLISKMLVFEANMRISISDIKRHQFFKDINWKDAEQKKLYPPFIPELEDQFSLKNFAGDNKIELYNNPMYEFEKQIGAVGKQTIFPTGERKFNPIGNFQLKKINKEFENLWC